MPSTSNTHAARLEIISPPSSLWAFEPNKVNVKLTNLGSEELASPGNFTPDSPQRIEGIVDLHGTDGSPRQRLYTVPLKQPVPIGQSVEHTLDIEIHDLAGDYRLEFGTQIAANGSEPRALAMDTSPHPFALKYTIFDAFMELINVCNFKCTFCPQPTLSRPPRSMDFELATKIVKDLQAMGHHHPIRLHVLGEPLLYKQFFDVVDMAHDHDQRIILATNGSRFDPKVVEGIIRTQLDELVISLNTPEKSTYYEQRGTDMTYEEYVASIERMVVAIVENPDRAPKTRVNILYSPEEINTEAQYFKTCEVANQWIDVIRNVTGNDIPRAEESLALEPGSTTLLPLAHNVELQWVVYHTWGENGNPNDRFCSHPWRQLPILVDGQATVCCVDAEGEIVLGDVNKQSIEEIWNGEPIQKLREGFLNKQSAHPRCVRCGHSDELEEFFPEAESA